MSEGEGEVQFPAGMDPATGEIVDPLALQQALAALPAESPAAMSLARKRSEQPQPLETADEVYEAVRGELRRMELAAARMAEVRKLLYGWYTEDGDYVAGAEFEYQEVYDTQVRDLFDRCHGQGQYEGQDKLRWPGEDVRTSIVNEHIPQDMREKIKALKGEMKTLEAYVNICKARMTGLVTLLSFHKEEMKMANFGGNRTDQPG
jgi:hypothetical protein